ncbi:MAG: 4Fe-4S dicluster domain-containing protein [Hyphomicrobiales bacterium]|nr:4Fe-4S dicluster domain-containing protein [Hyphomicrobiales bacterium]
MLYDRVWDSFLEAYALTEIETAHALPADGADHLIELLRRDGYTVIAPAVEDGAVVLRIYGEGDALPRGIFDRQSGGHYRLEPGDGDSLFAYANGPQGFKRHLWPPRQTLWSSTRSETGFAIAPVDHVPQKLALFAARSCDIEAIAILDQVFDNGDFADPIYRARRDGAFIVAVDCTRSGDTCFCASMGTGPAVTAGFDIALTELHDTAGHRLIARAGSTRGPDVLNALQSDPATDAVGQKATERVAAAAASQTRQMPADAETVLKANPEHPRWDEVAARCLTCGSCTAVCPTCFCSTTEDATDLAAATATRTRRWDSCFSIEFSYLHGGAVRRSPRSRYRQWITHKLAHWHDQFGRAGCVGCGRCITWCPVGIDIVEETMAIAATGKGAENG